MLMEGDVATLREHQQALYTLLVEFDRICRILHTPYILYAGSLLGAVRHNGFIPWDDDLDVMMLREDYEKFLQNADDYLNKTTFFLQKEFTEHWPMFFSKLRLNGTTCLEKYHPKDVETHQGVYMDIFPCDNAAGSYLGRKMQFYASKIVIAKSLDARGYDTDSMKKKLFIKGCRILPCAPFLRVVKGVKQNKCRMVQSFFSAASKFEKNIYSKDFLEKRTSMFFEGKEFPIPADYDGLLKILYGDYMKMPSEEERTLKKHVILVDLDNSYEKYIHYRDDMKFDVYTKSIR